MKSVAEELRGGLHPRRDTDSPPYFARPSAVLHTTLRRTLMQVRRRVSASKAESLVGQVGESRRVGRRVDRSTTKSLADELGLVKPLPLDVQWMEARYSMDGHTSVNGLSKACQWIERSDSMDGTRQFNGWTSTCPSGTAKRTSVLLRKCYGGQRRGGPRRCH